MDNEKILDRINEVYYGEIWSEENSVKSRHRIHWICQKAKGEHILDVGCSQGIVPIILGREGKKVIGIDLQKESIDYANNELLKENDSVKKCVEFIHNDFINNDFTEHSFDSIIMSEVLEHLTDPVRFVKRASELLKKDGLLVVTVPFGINDFFDHKKTYFGKALFDEVSEYFDVIDCQIIVSVETIKWIGMVGKVKSAEDIPRKELIDYSDMFESVEKGVLTLERCYLNKLKSLNSSVQKLKNVSGENADLKSERAKLREENQELKKETERLKKETERLKEENEKIAIEYKTDIEKDIQLLKEAENLQKQYDALKNSKLGRIQVKIWKRRNKNK